jgi:hypothetical protein
MPVDLSADQYAAVEQGVIVSPGGVRYHRRTTRAKRKQIDVLIDAGSSLVMYWPGGLPERTRVLWLDGSEAVSTWREARSAVTTDAPHPPAKGSVATVGVWRSDSDEPLLVLTWHH